MRKGFLIYDEMHKYFHHIWEGRWSCMTFHPILLNFLIYVENYLFLFYQCDNAIDVNIHWLTRNKITQIYILFCSSQCHQMEKTDTERVKLPKFKLVQAFLLHCEKRLIFPCQAGMSLTKLYPAGNNLINS